MDSRLRRNDVAGLRRNDSAIPSCLMFVNVPEQQSTITDNIATRKSCLYLTAFARRKGKAAPGTFCHDRNPADIRPKQVNFTRLLWIWILPFFMNYSGCSGESRYETDPEY